MPVHYKRGTVTDVGLRQSGDAQRKPIRVHRVRFAGTGELRGAARGQAVGVCPRVWMPESRHGKVIRTVTQHAVESERIAANA